MAAVLGALLEVAAEAMVKAVVTAARVMVPATVGAVAINEVDKKMEAADKAAAKPIAQAGTQSKTKKACDKCPPDCGTLVQRNWNMSDTSREYQARITGFSPGTEWSFEGADFDGFKSAACLLLEAKARYDQFFKSDGEPKFFFKLTGAAKIIQQAEKQSAVTLTSPPSQLHWHFMQPMSFNYFSGKFSDGLLPILSFLTP